MKKRILALAIILVWSRAAFAVNDLAPGTRIVPVMQHAMEMEQEIKQRPMFPSDTGEATFSIYPTPEIDKTLGVNSSLIWTFGVIGGDRAFLPAAQNIFMIDENTPDPERINTFIALRERLYPATAWSVGYGQFHRLEKTPDGYRVTVLGMNLAPLKKETRAEIRKAYPNLSKEAAEVLSEWRAFNRLQEEEVLHKLRHTKINIIVPLNDIGKLNYHPAAIEQILDSPERVLLEIKEALKEDAPVWAKKQMGLIRFMLKHSDNMYVSPELQRF